MKRTNQLAVVLMSAMALMLGGCGGSSDKSSADSGDGVKIVASTNVYGDIARTVAGENADITSIITAAAQDPHSYEASAQDQLAVSKADLVIENGGGYDPFVTTLLKAASNEDAVVLNASDISGLAPGGDHAHEEEEGHANEEEEGHAHEEEEGHEGHDHIEGFNEHVWYDLHSVEHVAEEISHELSELDPDNAKAYEANFDAFATKITDLEKKADNLKAKSDGRGIAITEPVPLYLLQVAGLTNETPEDFSEAIEEGADVSASALKNTLDLFDGDKVALLAYNEQTSSSETEQVRKAAEAANVPVVNFTETLPEGKDYATWMSDNLDAISGALG